MATSITSNGLVMASSQSLSADVNVLDDYQEGTSSSIFTHTNSTYNYIDQQNYYVKLGKQVFFSAYTAIDASGNSFSGTSNTFGVAGLPFSLQNVSNYFGICTVGYIYKINFQKSTSGDKNGDHLFVRLEANTTTGWCGVHDHSTYAWGLDGASCVANSARFQYGGHYITPS
jgi:hypothetical protein